MDATAQTAAVHWEGSAAPVVVATAAWNGMGATPHQVWAWRRAEMNAFTESPFLCANSSRAIMAHIRTLPMRSTGTERLVAIGQALLEPLAGRLSDTGRGELRVALSFGLAERFGRNDRQAERTSLEQAFARVFLARGIEVATSSLPLGHAAFARTILDAGRALGERAADVVILGGVDTYYEPDAIDELTGQRRLFDGDNLDSLLPGEGGAFCVLVRAVVARRLGWPHLARIESAAVGYEPAAMGSEVHCAGLGLSRPLRAIADRLATEQRSVDLWLTDLTNETYRAQEWLLAFARVADASSATAEQQSIAERLGDLGAASMPTGVVLAAESFLRGAPDAATCVVSGSSVGHERGAVLLARVDDRAEGDADRGSRTNDVRSLGRAAPGNTEAVCQTDERRPDESSPARRLGLVSYAATCAEVDIFPARAESAWAKWGMAPTMREAEHAAWRSYFALHPEERDEYRRQLEQFRAHWLGGAGAWPRTR